MLVLEFNETLLYISFTDDHSRVLLSHIDGYMGSDYINASYIDVSTFSVLLK